VEIAERLAVLLPGRSQLTVQRHDLAILNQTRPPAVLVECGFLSNEQDAEILRTRPILLARAIAGGICAWCSWEPAK
jgi:N-acetylmuramoyl-L-alanine amidase